MSSQEYRAAKQLQELKLTEKLRQQANDQLQVARSLPPEELYRAVDRWVVALHLLDLADNAISETIANE